MAAAVVIGVLFERLHKSPPAVQPFALGRRRDRVPDGRPADHGHRHLQHAGHHQFQRGAGGPLDAALTPDDLQVFDWLEAQHRADGHRSRSIRCRATRRRGRTCRPSASGAWPRPADLDGAAGEVSAGAPTAIRTIFDEAPLLAYERAVRAGINYVIVGPPERDGTSWRRRAIRFDSRT